MSANQGRKKRNQLRYPHTKVDPDKILKAAADIEKNFGKIHTALTVRGRDGQTRLERIVGEIAAGVTTNFEPLKGRESDHEEEPPDDSDPEAKTPPPAYSDRTGESAIRLQVRHPQIDGERVQNNLTYMLGITAEVLLILTRYVEPHAPSSAELIAAREVEAANEPTDDCRHCAKEGIRSPAVATYLHPQSGSEIRVCAFCVGHRKITESEPCPTCDGLRCLPTGREIREHHAPPRTMRAS